MEEWCNIQRTVEDADHSPVLGLLGATLERITLDSPGENTDRSAGCDEQRAASAVATEELLRGETWMTAISSPRPEGSDRTAGLGSCVGEPLMTRPPGYSLPPLPSFHDSLVNIDGAVRRYFRMTIETEQRTLERRWLMKQLEARARRPCRTYRWDYENWTYEHRYADPRDALMLRDGWQSILDHGDIHEVMWNFTLSNLLTIDGNLRD